MFLLYDDLSVHDGLIPATIFLDRPNRWLDVSFVFMLGMVHIGIYDRIHELMGLAQPGNRVKVI